MNNTEKLKLLRELKRREKEKIYKKDFAIFAQEQIKILPKDSSKGFIPFEFNEAQRIVDHHHQGFTTGLDNGCKLLLLLIQIRGQ